jgi:hypothetical protein
MKPFMPFLLVPVLSLGGWALSMQATTTDPLALPAVMTLDAPPALGVVIPAADSQAPVRVPVDVLLPPVSRPAMEVRAVAPQDLPQVSAILVEGKRKVAQINGSALTIGESYGLYRVVAIENHRVQFDHPALRQKRWVNVLDR